MLPARLTRCCSGLLLTLLLGACATPPQTAALQQQTAAAAAADRLPPAPQPALPYPAAARIAALPFLPQEAWQCGPAALATLLQHHGIASTPQQLVPLVYVPGRKGSFQIELGATARQHGLLVYTLAPSLAAVLQEVAAGHPVLVLQNLGLDWLPRWHFAVVRGYDLHRGELLLNSGRHENLQVPLATFERTWARAGHWAQVMLPASQLPATAEPQALFRALAALQEVGRLQDAARGFASALQRWPEDGTLLLGAGNLHYVLGERSQALQAFERAVRLQPDSAVARNNLAQLLLESGAAAAALVHAEQAVALGGDFAVQAGATLAEVRRALE